MAIGSINSVNFSGVAATQNGNEYKKTYIGRIVGTGVGVGLAAVTLRAKSGADKIVNFVQKYNDFIKKVMNNTAKENPAIETNMQKFMIDGEKILSSTKLQKVLKYATPIVAAWLLIGGYIKGAIVDKVINAKRSGKADDAAIIA